MTDLTAWYAPAPPGRPATAAAIEQADAGLVAGGVDPDRAAAFARVADRARAALPPAPLPPRRGRARRASRTRPRCRAPSRELPDTTDAVLADALVAELFAAWDRHSERGTFEGIAGEVPFARLIRPR